MSICSFLSFAAHLPVISYYCRQLNRHANLMSIETIRERPNCLLNYTVKKNWQILKVLGKGTFSVVYQCQNQQTKQKMAIKIATCKYGEKMLSVEKKLYREISGMYGNGETGFVKYYEHGKTGKFTYLVMERQSASVEDIFIKMGHQFTVKTVLNIGIQAVKLLEKFHKLGYVHRDIKPSNFLIAHGNNKDRILLVDFGLARKYKNYLPEKPQPKDFVGTKRYASVAAHLGLEQGRKDDLESLGYMLVYLLKGRLPWQGLPHVPTQKRYETIGDLKQQINIDDLCLLDIKGELHYKGRVLFKLLNYVRALKYEDQPNYQFLVKEFTSEIKMIEEIKCNENTSRWRGQELFDWIDVEKRKSVSQGKHSRQKAKTKEKDRRRSPYSQSSHRDRYLK